MVTLSPGVRISLSPGFMVNDDNTDNCFIAGAIRFVPVTEDEEPQFLLACEYRSFIR